MEDVHFRRAAKADLPAIVALLADDRLGSGREDPSLPLDAGYIAAFARIDADPNQLLLVADMEGQIIGTLQLTLLPGLSSRGMSKALIEAVRVATPLRSRGVGRMLVEHAVEEARRRGCGVVQLSTDKSRLDAHRFYARLGFKASHEGMKRSL